MQALKYHVVVKENGIVEVPKVPFKAGQKIEIIILPEGVDEAIDLLAASGSSLDFWDNPIDNEVWNDV